MIRPFKGNFPVTQTFNDTCCQASYVKFGMKGHNGYDYGTPAWTPIIAPHKGKVLEAQFDAGYGNYVKIDNGVEGSVLAHLAQINAVVGREVTEGELIGYSGNTGNSSGPHLHWGYYRHPRNRNNGFAGYIDQDPYLKEPVTPTPTPPASNNDYRKAGQFNLIVNVLYENKKISTNNSDKLLDNEPVLGAVKNLLKENMDLQAVSAGNSDKKYSLAEVNAIVLEKTESFKKKLIEIITKL